MEPLAAYPLKCSGSKAKIFAILLSMLLCTVMLFLLQLKFLKPRINSFYSFEVKDAKGRVVSLEKFKGKASLVVNVASDCRFTDKSYLTLKELQKEFGPYHFNVLAFPCNQFGDSEPKSSKEVESFARKTYGVTFPIFHKIKILGPEAEPAFRFVVGKMLKTVAWFNIDIVSWTLQLKLVVPTPLGLLGTLNTLDHTQNSSKKEPRWNFWKYLVNPEGKVVKFWRPEEPLEAIRPHVSQMIGEIILKKKEDL